MTILTYAKDVLSTFFKSLKRFPVPSFFSILLAALFIIKVHNVNVFSSELNDILDRILLVVGLSIALFLLVAVLLERIKLKVNIFIVIAANLCAAGFLFLYYLFFIEQINDVSIMRYFLTLLSFIAIFCVIPYLTSRENNELYIMKIFIRAVISVFYSLVLIGGISGILLAIDKLLGVTINENLYIDVRTCALCIFAILYFICGIPNKDSELKTIDYNIVLKILFLYILIPLSTIYTIILYLYFGKTIILSSWTNGFVAHLIVWYAIVVVILVYLIKPIVNDNKWAKIYSFWIIKAIIPLIGIMFYSIWIRISNYGITERRYYVVLAGLIILTIMIYWNISKVKNNVMVAFCVALLLPISYLGPWSPEFITIKNQNNNFEEILNNNHMLENGKIKTSDNTISKNDMSSLSSIIQYFDSNYSLAELNYLPEDFKLVNFKQVFGFDFIAHYLQSPQYVNYYNEKTFIVHDIKDFDYVIEANYNTFDTSSTKNDSFEFKYLKDEDTIQVLMNEKILYAKNMKDFFKNIAEKHPITLDPRTVEDVIFEGETQDAKVMIVFKMLNFTIDGENYNEESMICEIYLKVKTID